MRRVVVVASASGNGKTTLAKALAAQLRVPFVEMDALVHGPNWTEATAEELRERVEPIIAAEGWVVDNAYRGRLGDLLLERADTIVWLDLPMRVWVSRLWRRTRARIRGDEKLWNDNVETWRTAFVGRESLFVWALRSHFRRRRTYPTELARFNVVRLRTPKEVEEFLARST